STFDIYLTSHLLMFFFFIHRRPSRSTLFPYTTLFRSLGDINGTYGMVGFLIGGLLGGFFVAKKGLSTKILFFLCCMMNVPNATRSEEHTSELQSRENLVCRLLLEKKNFDD